jgi:hypothetical protein
VSGFPSNRALSLQRKRLLPCFTLDEKEKKNCAVGIVLNLAFLCKLGLKKASGNSQLQFGTPQGF